MSRHTANADARRRQVAMQAASLFDHAGYHTTNMTEIAQAVALEKPTLYHYFSGKDEILFWIHEEFIDLVLAKADARAAENLPPEAALRATMRDLLGLMDTHPAHVRVFFEYRRELSDEQRARIQVKRDRYEEYVVDIVQQGMRAGVYRDLNPRLVALAVFGMCNWTQKWYRSGGPLTAEQLSDFFYDLLLRGLGTKR